MHVVSGRGGSVLRLPTGFGRYATLSANAFNPGTEPVEGCALAQASAAPWLRPDIGSVLCASLSSTRNQRRKERACRGGHSFSKNRIRSEHHFHLSRSAPTPERLRVPPEIAPFSCIVSGDTGLPGQPVGPKPPRAEDRK